MISQGIAGWSNPEPMSRETLMFVYEKKNDNAGSLQNSSVLPVLISNGRHCSGKQLYCSGQRLYSFLWST